MGAPKPPFNDYFVFGFPLADRVWTRYDVTSVLPADLAGDLTEPSREIRSLADRIGRRPHPGPEASPPAELLLALRTVNQALRWLSEQYLVRDNPGALPRGRDRLNAKLGDEAVRTLYGTFVDLFPPLAVKVAHTDPAAFLAGTAGDLSGLDRTTLEMILLFLNGINPATRDLRELFDDSDLRRRATYVPFVTGLEEYLEASEPPGSTGDSLFHLLRSPMLASPDSLAGQIAWMRDNWAHLLPPEIMDRLALALDVLKEIDVARGGEPGPPPVLEFGPGSPGWEDGQPEPEAFSRDADWMSNVVLLAKSTYVWLDQLSRTYGHPVHTLDQVPDEELDRLARYGVTGLWLIGLWERSEASRTIKQWRGNPDAAASAYALKAYRIADDLGGEEAYRNLKDRADRRGIRLASDMVPNHMGIDSDWVIEHPDWFLQLDQPPYPAYRFTGESLCRTDGVEVRIEDGYWDNSDAAVVFQRTDNSGRARYIYHGNDGTSMPWNDTAQLDFLQAEVREAVTQVILQVARMFPIIRFDAAMTLAKKHYQRLWFPAPGDAGAIPSRAEHGMTREEFNRVFPHEFWRQVVDRVAAEVPDTLLLAEAFWLMEGYFVRTLGMHRVYNSAFMNMLKMEDNQKYRQTVKNVLEFSPAVLGRFVNFMNNPDEKTAVEQFGRGDKYFGCALLLVTMPGLPMLGHGQIEGFSEKYGMEYRRAAWDEQVDHDMVARHERDIFPLMRRRHLFSGSDLFNLFDFIRPEGWVDENVFAYVNGHGSERALVLYNNSYESTHGHLRLASPVNRGPADTPHLVRRSLAEALDLETSGGSWYIFRDHIDRLEYLVGGARLGSEGFHTHLDGYQYRVLLDWRRVEDPSGSWYDLHEALGGRGVPDMMLARREREIAPALERISAWTDPDLLAWLEPPVAGKTPAAVPVPPPVPADLPAGPAERLSRLTATPAPWPVLDDDSVADKEFQAIALGLGGSLLSQALYLAAVLRALPGPDPAVDQVRLADIPLFPQDAPLFQKILAENLRTWTGHDFAAGQAAALAALLAAVPDPGPNLARGRIAWFGDWLTDPQVLTFLKVNSHEGVQYFHRESLEILLDAVVLEAVLEDDSASLVPLMDARSLILDHAESSEFRLEVMKTHFVKN